MFEQCGPIQSWISYSVNINLDDIYGSIDDQVRTIKILIKIYHIGIIMKECLRDLWPGPMLIFRCIDNAITIVNSEEEEKKKKKNALCNYIGTHTVLQLGHNKATNNPIETQ